MAANRKEIIAEMRRRGMQIPEQNNIKQESSSKKHEAAQELARRGLPLPEEQEPMELELNHGQKKQYPDTYLNQFSNFIGKKFPALEEFANYPKVSKATNAISGAVMPTAEGVIGAGDSLRNLLSAGYAKPSMDHPSNAYNAGRTIGDVGSFIGGGSLTKSLPGISKIPEYLGSTGTGGIAQRLLGSEAFGLLGNKDRGEGAMEGLKGGLLGEAIGFPLRGVGALAEQYNPIKHAEQAQHEIAAGAQEAKKAMEKAYSSVHNQYGDNMVTANPVSYLNFPLSEKRQFTPNVTKLYKNFLEEPTFKNMHNLQSKMGSNAAKTTDLNQRQALTNARNKTMDKISSFLKLDKAALAQYNKGKDIARDEYFPFLSGKKLSAVANGKKTDLSPQQLVSEITKAKESSNIPENHALIPILEEMQKKVGRGQMFQHLTTSAAGIGGLLGGGPAGALLGPAAHFVSPHLLQLAQNPNFINAIKKLHPLMRGSTTTSFTNDPMELELIGSRRK